MPPLIAQLCQWWLPSRRGDLHHASVACLDTHGRSGDHRIRDGDNMRPHKNREKKPQNEVAIMAVPPMIDREIFHSDATQAELPAISIVPRASPAIRPCSPGEGWKGAAIGGIACAPLLSALKSRITKFALSKSGLLRTLVAASSRQPAVLAS
ncbi:MAG TPA: hypothetical protein VNS34_24495 [Rhizobiaceae bacterium]|nr:hypothetical protein [Rhizobiaceae bacterium]